jgi:segregation and condensation protein A
MLPPTTHSVRLPDFEGPLDLLLQLIEREELDITAISLAQVTDQYLTVIGEMDRLGLGDLTSFLVIAAKLVLIKSRALLPRPPSDRPVPGDDVATELIHQLEEYRRFKYIAQELAGRAEAGQQAYVRVATPRPSEPSFDLTDVTLEALLAAAQEALHALPAAPVNSVIAAVPITVADQTARIQDRLAQKGRVSFQEMLSEAATRMEVIVTLMALLELLKQDRITVRQEGLFGPILIEARTLEPGADASPGASPATLPLHP